MDDAVRTRNAAREALADIEPERLRTTLRQRFADTSMTPGVLTFLSARALDTGISFDALAERAAGVQLIYEGLRLTQALVRDEPWTTESDLDADIAADMEVLAADVLVSRGFYLLARTDAAEQAVETVRAFGADQTRRRAPDADVDALDRNLDANIFALAVVAGTTAVGGDPPEELLSYMSDLARDHEGELPPAGSLLPEAAVERIASLSSSPGTDGRVTSSATDR